MEKTWPSSAPAAAACCAHASWKAQAAVYADCLASPLTARRARSTARRTPSARRAAAPPGAACRPPWPRTAPSRARARPEDDPPVGQAGGVHHAVQRSQARAPSPALSATNARRPLSRARTAPARRRGAAAPRRPQPARRATAAPAARPAPRPPAIGRWTGLRRPRRLRRGRSRPHAAAVRPAAAVTGASAQAPSVARRGR